MNRETHKEKFRKDIEGLRGVAALFVILFHLQIYPFKGGFVGVDIFFVISGFLITKIVFMAQQRNEFTYGGFIKSRFLRLYPALFFCLTTVSIVATLVFSPVHFIAFAQSLISAIFSTSNFYFLSQAGYFDISAYLKPLLHTWTLSVEWQFYLIWPVLVWFVTKLNSSRNFFIFVAITAVLYLFQELIYALPSHSSCGGIMSMLCRDGGENIYFLMPSRAFEFSIGAAAAFLPATRIRKLGATVLNMISVVAILALTILIDPADKFPALPGLVVCLFTAIIIHTPNGYGRFLLENGAIRFVGRISYSLYLFHWPVIVFWGYIDSDVTLIDNIFIVIIFTTLAVVSYHLFEKPRSHFRRNLIAYPHVSIGVVAGLLTISSLHAIYSKGWTWRSDLPDDLTSIENPADLHARYYGGYADPISSEGRPQYILSGDSYGDHYAYGLNSLQKDGVIESWIKSSGLSCFHLPNLTRVNKGTDFDCAKFLRNTLNYANEEKSASIIISYAWAEQIEIASIVGETDKRGISEQQLFDSLSDFFGQVDNEVIVIGMLPRTGRGELWSNLTSTRFVSAVFQDDDWRYSQANQSYIDFNERLGALVRKHGQKFVDPFDYLCEKNICTNVTPSGKLIYSDAGHLSIFGSEYFVGLMKDRGILGNRS